MNAAPPSPRRANLDRRMCVAANRWGARRAIGIFFGAISRLGDGVFWYSLMTVIAVVGGWRGVAVALQMAVTGLTALMLYRVLKRWTRRPRPFPSPRRARARRKGRRGCRQGRYRRDGGAPASTRR